MLEILKAFANVFGFLNSFAVWYAPDAFAGIICNSLIIANRARIERVNRNVLL